MVARGCLLCAATMVSDVVGSGSRAVRMQRSFHGAMVVLIQPNVSPIVVPSVSSYGGSLASKILTLHTERMVDSRTMSPCLPAGPQRKLRGFVELLQRFLIVPHKTNVVT